MAANPTIIKQNVNDWFDILKKLSAYELFPEEQTIIEFLKDYWRNFSNVGDDDGQCQSYIEELKTFKNKHPKTPEVSTLCNQLRGLAEKNFLKDNDTYHLFQQTAREYVKQHKPQAPKPQQQPKPQQPKPQPPQQQQPKPQPQPAVNTAIIRVNVKDWFEAMHDLAISSISDDEMALIEWLWKYPLTYANMGEDSDQCRTCLQLLKEFKNKHAKDPGVVTLSNKVRGIAEKMFLVDNATYQAFRQMVQQVMQEDDFYRLSPMEQRENFVASNEFEQELLDLFNSNTSQPQAPKPQQQPKPQQPTKPTGFTRQTTPTQKPTTTTVSTATKKDDSNLTGYCGCLAIIIAVLYFGGCSWLKGLIFGNSDKDEDEMDTMYILAENINLLADADDYSKVLGTISYGDKLKADYDKNTVRVKAEWKGKEGYVNREALVYDKELEEMQAIWGGDGTRQEVSDIRHRRALLLFVNEMKRTGNYDKDGGYTLHASGNNTNNVWRNSTLGGNGVFAFIVEKKNGNGRIACLCDFTQQGRPNICIVQHDVADNQYINKVTLKNGQYKIVLAKKSRSSNRRGRGNSSGGQQNTNNDDRLLQPLDPPSTGFHLEKIE